MRLFGILFFLVSPLMAEEKTGVGPHGNGDLIVKLLGEQLMGEIADYNNSQEDWKLIMEARIRHIMFSYWVNIEKFNVQRVELLEVRFGEIVMAIKKNKAFDRTFVEPNFIASADDFPKHSYNSTQGDHFNIESIEKFKIENAKFLKFLEMCVNKSNDR